MVKLEIKILKILKKFKKGKCKMAKVEDILHFGILFVKTTNYPQFFPTNLILFLVKLRDAIIL